MFLWKGGWALSDSASRRRLRRSPAFFLYMVAFMDTTATIPTGAMAERWKWKAFVGWGLFCGAIYYPLFGAWTWGGGWLAKLGNSMEPRLRLRRLRRFRRRARRRWRRRPSPGRSCSGPASASTARTASRARCPATTSRWRMLGTFILLFGWFGFNAARRFAATDVQFAIVAANTAIAAAFGATVGDVLRA